MVWALERMFKEPIISLIIKRFASDSRNEISPAMGLKEKTHKLIIFQYQCFSEVFNSSDPHRNVLLFIVERCIKLFKSMFII